MDFSVMFWGDVSRQTSASDPYRGVLEIAKYADEHGYSAVWLPERHFHPWGGLHPNPAVTAAAVAAVTKKVRLRAGSCVLPLHHPIRVAEEWAVVDNLSGGRVELAFATGWRDDDFVLAPEKNAKRKHDVWGALESVRGLWRGGRYSGVNGSGRQVEVAVYPRPVQPELPIWITSAGSLRTLTDAGSAGMDLLTHLLGQDYADVEKKVAQYRAYRLRNGHKTRGKVALMLHTFLGKDRAEVKETVREAFSAYLLNSADLMIPAEHRAQWEKAAQSNADRAMVDEMVAQSFARYFETASLMGTPDSCLATVKRLAAMGVDEVCCLVDFGLDLDRVKESLPYLTELKERAR
jgi:natural product biosynthesis luciferase-like monooxygenase protein